MWLALFAAAISLVEFKRVAAWLDLTQLSPGVEDVSVVRADALAIGWAVRIAAVRAPWTNTCLVQALAGTQMLRRRGIASILTLGVAMTSKKNERMIAHAWLQQGGAFLTGETGHQQFTPVSIFVCKSPQ
ncbi:MAG: lasso peptide biosynthesis B2 protein [Caldilineaceae bacterium]|nr:lasso peptide biosynthesis B2 protein [Caldilineaceae bacterium]